MGDLRPKLTTLKECATIVIANYVAPRHIIFLVFSKLCGKWRSEML